MHGTVLFENKRQQRLYTILKSTCIKWSICFRRRLLHKANGLIDADIIGAKIYNVFFQERLSEGAKKFSDLIKKI